MLPMHVQLDEDESPSQWDNVAKSSTADCTSKDAHAASASVRVNVNENTAVSPGAAKLASHDEPLPGFSQPSGKPLEPSVHS